MARLILSVSGHIKIMTPDNMSDSGETIIQSSSLDVYEKILLGNPGKMSRCICFIGMLIIHTIFVRRRFDASKMKYCL